MISQGEHDKVDMYSKSEKIHRLLAWYKNSNLTQI